MANHRNFVIPTVFEKDFYSADIYSKMLSERVIFLNGEVNEYTTNMIVSQLLYLEHVDDKEDITLYINSPGGSVHDGVQVVDIMNLIKPNVATIVTGLAASMGMVIASNGTKGKRYALPNASVMMHQISYGTGGNIQDIRVGHDHSEKLNNRLMGIVAKNCGKSLKQVLKDSVRDKWFDAEEAIDYGIIDKVITNRE